MKIVKSLPLFLIALFLACNPIRTQPTTVHAATIQNIPAQASRIIILRQDSSKNITVLFTANNGQLGSILINTSSPSTTVDMVTDVLCAGIPTGFYLMVRQDQTTKLIEVTLVSEDGSSGQFLYSSSSANAVRGAVLDRIYTGLGI